MIASVSASLRILHIVTSGKDCQVILFGKHICDQINIRRKRTTDTDAGNIVYIADHVFYAGVIAMSFQFFNNTLRSFDPVFDMFDRVVELIGNYEAEYCENRKYPLYTGEAGWICMECGKLYGLYERKIKTGFILCA